MIKTKWKRKWKIPHTLLKRKTLEPIWQSQIRNSTLMSWNWRKKERVGFLTIILSEGFFYYFGFILVHTVLNKLSEYIYFYISKNIISNNFCLFLKLSKAFSAFLKTFQIRYIQVHRNLYIKEWSLSSFSKKKVKSGKGHSIFAFTKTRYITIKIFWVLV